MKKRKREREVRTYNLPSLCRASLKRIKNSVMVDAGGRDYSHRGYGIFERDTTIWSVQVKDARFDIGA
jgi:hypothetical protein